MGSKVLSDPSFPTHSDVWEEWEEEEQIDNDSRVRLRAMQSRFSSVGGERRLVLVGERIFTGYRY